MQSCLLILRKTEFSQPLSSSVVHLESVRFDILIHLCNLRSFVHSDEYELDKAEYEKQLKAYHSSAGYQAYVSCKSKNSAVIVPDDKDVDRGMASTKLDRRIDIQPAEDENEYDEALTVKNLSDSRYMRNHRSENMPNIYIMNRW